MYKVNVSSLLVPKEWDTELPNVTVIPLLGIYPKETQIP